VEKALSDIENLIASKHTAFDAGENGFQVLYCAQPIQSCLHMVVMNGQNLIEASEHAAESQRICPGLGQTFGMAMGCPVVESL